MLWPKGSPASRFPTLSVPRPPRRFSAGPATSSLPSCAFVASPLARLEVLARSKLPSGGPPNSEQLGPQAVQPSASKWGAAGIAQRVDPAAPSRMRGPLGRFKFPTNPKALSPGRRPPPPTGRSPRPVRRWGFPLGKTTLYGANVLGTRRLRGFMGFGGRGRRGRRACCFCDPCCSFTISRGKTVGGSQSR